RFSRDWSSDVCSSDLEGVGLLPFHPKFSFQYTPENQVNFGNNVPISITSYDGLFVKASYIGRNGEGRESDILNTEVLAKRDGIRSEERRVGKECRGRW